MLPLANPFTSLCRRLSRTMSLSGGHKPVRSAFTATTLILLGACTTSVPSDRFHADAKQMALTVVGKRLGVSPSTLTVSALTQATYSHLGHTVLELKIADSQGGLHGIAIHPDLRPIDPEKLAEESRAAQRGKLGALDASLAAQLRKAGKDPLKVVLWVIDTTPRSTDRLQAHGKSQTTEEIDKFYKKIDTARGHALEKLVRPVLERVLKFDPNARADTGSPAIAAHLSPAALRALADDPEIDRIYLDPPAEAELDIAKVTTGITSIHSAGTLGSGIRVAAIEGQGGRAENASLLLRPVVQDDLNVCATADDHATAVAGIFKERRFALFPPPVGEDGLTPNAELRMAGSCSTVTDELRLASTRAADWGARALNLSWGLDTGLAVGATDRFYDDMTFNRWRTIVKSAGNRANHPNCFPNTNTITSPGLAYNVITVGGFDDHNTVSWADDTIYECSSSGNPMSTHNDREKPEIAAPAVNLNIVTIGRADLQNFTGTSGAAPQVTATAALLMERNGRLSVWPEIIRAVLMATATHNIEGNSRLSDVDGAGGMVANAAADLIGDPQRWNGLFYGCGSSTPARLDLATLSVGPRTRHRVVLSWDTDPAFPDYGTRPSADIDLRVVDLNGRVVASSMSWDNTFEIVEFDSFFAGTYTVQAVRFRCDLPTWLGWAWHTLPMPIP